MENIYLINYAVKGIKNIDEWAELSFYKKTISKDFDIRKYNMKAVYGANGAGKSAIISSVQSLQSILIDKNYLNNPYAQKQLAKMVNKQTGELSFRIDFLAAWKNELILYRYQTTIACDTSSQFAITEESLSEKKATAHSNDFTSVYQVRAGELVVNEKENAAYLTDLTKNLLDRTSFVAAFVENLVKTATNGEMDPAFTDGTYAGYRFTLHLMSLYLFGQSLYVYLSEEDTHTDFFINNLLADIGTQNVHSILEALARAKAMDEQPKPYTFSEKTISIDKSTYASFEKETAQLFEFLRIFKTDLVSVDIEKREDKDVYRCNLLMNYGTHSVDAEFESTGIKKLIKLFSYFKKMVAGGIVFIDELDSNLHDVYLCALLEYLMEHGKGQLCFTTHNIGPMDILKRNKKSIDFLSVDHKIYSWTKNGNYSPSTLYRNGMIEGSPFNVDSVDFLHVFPLIEEA